MNPIPHDITRCYGQNCPQKQQCRRFATLRIDPPVVLSYATSLIDDTGQCDSFIKIMDQPT